MKVSHYQIVNMKVCVSKTFILFPGEHNNILISEAHDHSEMIRQIQRQSSESSISINSRTSLSNISLSSDEKFVVNNMLFDI